MSTPQVMQHTHGGRTAASAGAKRLLAFTMAIFIAATAVGLAALWPHGAPAKEPWLYEGASLVTGTVVEAVPGDPTPGQDEPGDEGEGAGGGYLRVLLDSGETVEVPEDPSAPVTETRVGQRVKIMTIDTGTGTEEDIGAYTFMDYERGVPLLILALVFVAAVVAVARWKGVAALAGLVVALSLVWTFTLPALRMGKNPLLVALVTAAAVMLVVVYLAHGISVKTTTALLGTFAGIAAMTALAYWAIPATSLTPLQDEVMGQLPYVFPGIDARGILLCAMVLAGVGVLNDVTVTQASSVWELRAAVPQAPRRTVFAHAMRIGRDHIASIVYTIAFAYVGTALAMLLLASRLDFTIIELLTFNTIAQEIVATLVAAISLIAAIPITTALASWLAGSLPLHVPTTTQQRGPDTQAGYPQRVGSDEGGVA